MLQLIKYHTDPEFREMYIKRSCENTKHRRIIDRYNHYKKLTEDKEYLLECKIKGLRIRNCPEEFIEILRELIKN
jgi:hypothetical protein